MRNAVSLLFLLLTQTFISGYDPIEEAEKLLEEDVIPAIQAQYYKYRKNPRIKPHFNVSNLRICRCTPSWNCGLTDGWTYRILELTKPREFLDRWRETCVTDGDCIQVQENRGSPAFGCLDLGNVDTDLHGQLNLERVICRNRTNPQLKEEHYWICCNDRSYCANETVFQEEVTTRPSKPFSVKKYIKDNVFSIILIMGILLAIAGGTAFHYRKKSRATHQPLPPLEMQSLRPDSLVQQSNGDALASDSDHSRQSTLNTTPGEVASTSNGLRDYANTGSSDASRLAPSMMTEMTGVTESTDQINTLLNDPKLKLLRDLESTMGSSGAGLTLLQPKSLAHQIQREKAIGEGRFGNVFLGHFDGEDVAVKIFKVEDEAAYLKEVSVYQLSALRHPNLLRFIGNDRCDIDGRTELWLLTEYHERGSLYDFLQARTVDLNLCYDLIRSMANGVAFLHHEFVTGRCTTKPSVVHRDIKTRNIMVKNDLTCAIGDLGLAVTMNNETGEMLYNDTDKFGTTRYLAPEILADIMSPNTFEALRMADVYSFGLCCWEVMARCTMEEAQIFAVEPEMAIPYAEYVNRDPTWEEMREIVYDKHLRPTCNPLWFENERFVELDRLLQDCWGGNPTSRLTAVQVRMRIERIQPDVVGLRKIVEEEAAISDNPEEPLIEKTE
ncbi:unnamed protein product [Caenorhabditis angaria]|uniref:receptor protein serine/threonine kinase n=1 Tax=Caenorhabditis angaria TaxID=860376 RepID=A0A9P1IN79_9PELO|nr:unnamed protein product [Caenorhabditis angaria]